MVTQFLTYDLKVAVLLAVFYFCYRLLMERETLHHLDRLVLLSTLALSMVLPLCVITLHETVWVEPQPAAVVAPGTTPAYESLEHLALTDLLGSNKTFLLQYLQECQQGGQRRLRFGHALHDFGRAALSFGQAPQHIHHLRLSLGQCLLFFHCSKVLEFSAAKIL